MSGGIEFVNGRKDFEAYLKHNKYLVAIFTAAWCGPCQQIKPVLDEYYKGRPDGKVEFVRIDLELEPELAKEYRVTGLPTIIRFCDGKETGRIYGANIGALTEMLEKLEAVAASDESVMGRNGNGKNGDKREQWLELSGRILTGYEVLNGSIQFGEFEALNSMSLFKNHEESEPRGGQAKKLFRLDEEYKKIDSTIISDADSQLLFYVPFINISKIYSIMIKCKKVHEIENVEISELDEDELKNETQKPSLIKVWPNSHGILSFDEASADSNAPHVEKIEWLEDHLWYECKLKLVRFQKVLNLNILIDGDDEDCHTVIEKIAFIGVNGESREQGKVQKLDDDD